MSLVFLKNLLFRQTTDPRIPTRRSMARSDPSAGGGQSRLSSEDSARTITPYADLEAQERRPLLARGDGDGSRAPSPHPSNASTDFKVNARVISDATIGLSDGLTVPFALTAGLSALGDTKVVIFGSLAELIAGAISMGLGGYLGAKSELASYQETRHQTEHMIQTEPDEVLTGIRAVFEPFAIPPQTLDDLTKHLAASPHLTDFVMQFQHCAEEPASSRPLTSALTIAAGYFLGGLVPLFPYFVVRNLLHALYVSIAVMAVALFSFGYVKTCIVTGWRGSRHVKQGVFGGVQMVVIGGAAAGAAMALVKTFNGFVDDP